MEQNWPNLVKTTAPCSFCNSGTNDWTFPAQCVSTLLNHFGEAACLKSMAQLYDQLLGKPLLIINDRFCWYHPTRPALLHCCVTIALSTSLTTSSNTKLWQRAKQWQMTNKKKPSLWKIGNTCRPYLWPLILFDYQFAYKSQSYTTHYRVIIMTDFGGFWSIINHSQTNNHLLIKSVIWWQHPFR